MRRCGILLLGICFFCCEKAPRKPENILSQQEMVKVLAKIYVTEEKISRLGIRHDSAMQVFDLMEDKIYAHSGVTDSVFKKSVNYYMEHPKEMEQIYSALVDSLHLQEQKALSRPGQK